MDMYMEMVGYVAALFIGVSLGLVGAGGSILTLPLMVYFFGVPVLLATSYSLFVVGVTSLMGMLYQSRHCPINGKVVILFSLVSSTVVFLIRHYLMPKIPTALFSICGVPLTSSAAALLLFSLLMMAAARAMMVQKNIEEEGVQPSRYLLRLIGCGILVGLVTGLLGAGGGFILIPALVFLLREPIKSAIGTSLLIIAVNSLAGFALDLGHVMMDWTLLGFVTLVATGGVFLGVSMGRKLSATQLKVSFGWMIMVIGIMILVKELSQFLAKI